MDPTRDQGQLGSPVIRGGSGDGRKRVIGELDFFADSKKNNNNSNNISDHDQDLESPLRNRQLDVNTGLYLLTTNTSSDKSTVDDGSSDNNMDDNNKKPEFVALQVEMERMNSENQRLRGLLSQVNNNYQTLTMQIATLMQQRQQHNQKSETANQERNMVVSTGLLDENQRRFAAKRLSGSSPQNEIIESMDCKSFPNGNLREMGGISKELVVVDHDQDQGGGDDQDHGQEIATGSRWVPNKVARFTNNGTNNSREHEENGSDAISMLRKTRVSVRLRSESAMMSDGCQWRKYGQKMAKGNPCPRAYYRCTMSTGCPVRKQVQRCAEDQTILTTTYEGQHNHPLPPAAVAMAQSTTSAASMLLSGSMPSPDHHHLLNSNPNFFGRTSQIATLSASAPFPTITLDLTHNNNNSSSSFTADQIMSQLRQQGENVNNPEVLLGQSLANQCSKFMGLLSNPNPNNNNNELSLTPDHLGANPNLTAVLVAALTSFMGNNSNNNSGNNVMPNNNNASSVSTRGNGEKN